MSKKLTCTLTTEYVDLPPQQEFAFQRALELLLDILLEDNEADEKPVTTETHAPSIAVQP